MNGMFHLFVGRRRIPMLVCAGLLLATPRQAAALSTPGSGLIYLQTFDVDTANTAETRQAYPDIEFIDPTPGTPGFYVDGGVLHTPVPGNDGFNLPVHLDGPFNLSFRIGSSIGSTGFPVGVTFIDETAEVKFLFHPGFNGGAFRSDGLVSNTNMGFTPAVDVLHRMSILGDGEGKYDVRIVAGDDPMDVFEMSINGPVVDAATIHLWSGGRNGIFDNVRLSAIPEPSCASLALAVFGSLGLWRVYRGRLGLAPKRCKALRGRRQRWSP